MKIPFVYGKIAAGVDFTGRKAETEKLVLNFTVSANTILSSPGKWGKSSLAAHAAETVLRKRRRIRFCYSNLTNVRNEEQFYRNFAAAVLLGSSKKIREINDIAARYLVRYAPEVTLSAAPDAVFNIELNLKEVKKNPDDILDLPEKIAAEKKIKFIICIEEIQNISDFENAADFQKKLKGHFQKHDLVSYCMLGSNSQKMTDIFYSQSMPLYKFGEIIDLQKIPVEEWINFLKKRFTDTGKVIENKVARRIAESADCHPYYVQQLAQQCWFRTRSRCNNAIVDSAFSNLVLQLSMLFQNLVDSLSNTQVNFLKAVVNNVEQFSSQEVIIEYGLGTSGNIMKIKKALVSREVIDIDAGKVTILDPLFRAWLRDHYFRNR